MPPVFLGQESLFRVSHQAGLTYHFPNPMDYSALIQSISEAHRREESVE